MTTETQTQGSLAQPMIWLAVGVVAIIVLAYLFVW